MKKRMLGFVGAAFCIASLTGRASGTGSVSSAAEGAPGVGESQKLSVYTNFHTIQDLAEETGRDKVTVANLVPPGTEPYDRESQSNDIVGLEDVDVSIYSDVGMEHWADSVPDSLQNDRLVTIKAPSGISLLKGASEHEDEESLAGESAERKESSTDSHV